MRMRTILLPAMLVAGLAGTAIPAGAQIIPLGHRPTIGAIEAPASAKPGTAVAVTVKASEEGNAWCGMRVDFGDGGSEQVKIDGDNKFPVALQHTYAKAGTYTIKATGQDITTHKHCPGEASAKIQIASGDAAKKPAKSKAKASH